MPDDACSVSATRLHSRQLIRAAELLGKTMEIPLQKHAGALLHENRQAFRYSCLPDQK
jgi:hypothetical protein